MLYQDGNVSVDYDFARFGAKSYAINKINTVDVSKRLVRGKGAAIVCFIVAALFLLVAVGPSVQEKGPPVVAGVILAGVGFLLYRRPNIYEYDLFLRTSSSDAAALTTRDSDQVLRLRAAIESAIVGIQRNATI